MNPLLLAAIGYITLAKAPFDQLRALATGAPRWCNVVHKPEGSLMTVKSLQVTDPKTGLKTVRVSVSFPSDLYETLEKIARDKKVSVAWVVRDASDKYVNEQWPLFASKE